MEPLPAVNVCRQSADWTCGCASTLWLRITHLNQPERGERGRRKSTVVAACLSVEPRTRRCFLQRERRTCWQNRKWHKLSRTGTSGHQVSVSSPQKKASTDGVPIPKATTKTVNVTIKKWTDSLCKKHVTSYLLADEM